MIDQKHCFRKIESVIYKELEKEAALIDPYRRVLIKLNPTAQEIWKLLDGERPVTEIVEILSREFKMSENYVRDDVLDFLKQLASRELIR
jgi:hypothetical protein